MDRDSHHVVDAVDPLPWNDDPWYPATNSLWRGPEAPSADVLAEVELFNADPASGWARLLAAAADKNHRLAEREIRDWNDYAAAARSVLRFAEGLTTLRD